MISSNISMPLTIRCLLSFNGTVIGGHSKTIDKLLSLHTGIHKIGLGTIEIENPELWWPKEFGDQPLYDLEIILS